MKEEDVTSYIIKQLEKSNFKIIEFDYPGSGTGIKLLPNNNQYHGMINDIIAKKDKHLYIFENKDRYYPKDFEKLNNFKKNKKVYADSFKKKFNINLNEFNLTTFIGLPKSYSQKIKKDKRKLVDKIWEV